MKHSRHQASAAPLDSEALDRLALAYVSRYATTRAKLRYYLGRKVKGRGWEGADPPPIEAIVERLAGLGFIDDAAFALSKAASLSRRGLGARRLNPVLRAAGIADEDGADAHAAAGADAFSSALRFAERKRIGPFAAIPPDKALRSKQFAMMMRAGHSSDIARRLLDSPPGQIPEQHDF